MQSLKLLHRATFGTTVFRDQARIFLLFMKSIRYSVVFEVIKPQVFRSQSAFSYFIVAFNENL